LRDSRQWGRICQFDNIPLNREGRAALEPLSTAVRHMKPSRIAIVGNMNNAGFCILRYFRDLGADAHLLLYSNDGQDTLSHFKPECDTWEIEKWSPFIHQTEIPNAVFSGLPPPLSWVVSLRSYLKSRLGSQVDYVASASKETIKQTYTGYAKYIGNGIAPAMFSKAGLVLDIFYPYSSGVEFLDTGEFEVGINKMHPLKRALAGVVKEKQKEGICNSHYVLNAEMGITQDALKKIGSAPISLAIPAVYNREKLPLHPADPAITRALERVKKSDFTILHHSRLLWENPGDYSDDAWRLENKNSNWLLEAFAKFTRQRTDLSPLLIMVEYGPDVTTAKKLCDQLELGSHVLWLPKMDRRHLMWLLAHVSIGVGQFYDVPKIIWGGTGWENLASGRPLLQGYQFEDGEFEQLYGYPPPPMLPVRFQDDILKHLLDMADNPEKQEQIGKGAKEWFNRYNGIGLAKQWLELLKAPCGKRGVNF
jgi:hypothetical protein